MADKEAAEAAKAAEKKKKAEVARAKAKAVAQTKKHGACGFDEESFHNVREGWEAIKEYLRELEVLFTVVGVKDKHDEKVTWAELILRTVKLGGGGCEKAGGPARAPAPDDPGWPRNAPDPGPGMSRARPPGPPEAA